MTAIWTFTRTAAIALTCLLVLDVPWLMSTAEPLYRPALAAHLASEPDLRAAGLFYLLYAVGLTALAVRPLEAGVSWRSALARGALFGLVAYATYDPTNQATMAGWPWALTAIDMVWGTVLSGAAAGGAALVVGRGAGIRVRNDGR